GLFLVDTSERVQRFHFDEGESHAAVRRPFEDREGNIWVGTDGLGLRRLKRRAFRSYTVRQGLAEDLIKAVAPLPNGSVWAANSWGIDEWSPHHADAFVRQIIPLSLAWSA